MSIPIKLDKFDSLVFVSGWVILPLISWAWSSIPFEIPKVVFFFVWTQILIYMYIFKLMMGVVGLHQSGNQQINLSKLIKSLTNKVDPVAIKLIFLFILVIVVSTAFGSDPLKSVVGNYYRRDGLITLFYLLIYWFWLTLNWRAKWSNTLTKAILIGAGLTSFWTLLIGATRIFGLNKSVFWQGAIGTSFGNPNFMAGYLVASLPLCWFALHKQTKSRLTQLGIGLGLLLSIWLTKSMAGLLLIGVWLWLELWLNQRLNKKMSHYIGWSGLIISFFIISWATLNKLMIPGSIGESRQRIITKLVLAVTKRPWGYGWANVDYAFNNVAWPEGQLRSVDVKVDKAHSSLLEILVVAGIPGLVIYLILIGYVAHNLLWQLQVARTADKFWWRTMLTVFILLILHSQMNVISIAEEVLFWTVAAIASQKSHKNLL